MQTEKKSQPPKQAINFILLLFILILVGGVIVYFSENPIGPLKIVSSNVASDGNKGYTYSVVIHNESSVPHSGFVKINTGGYFMEVTRHGGIGHPNFLFKEISLQPNETITIDGTVSSNWMFNTHIETSK